MGGQQRTNGSGAPTRQLAGRIPSGSGSGSGSTALRGRGRRGRGRACPPQRHAAQAKAAAFLSPCAMARVTTVDSEQQRRLVVGLTPRMVPDLRRLLVGVGFTLQIEKLTRGGLSAGKTKGNWDMKELSINAERGYSLPKGEAPPSIDWDSLRIDERHDEEGRLEINDEDQLYKALRLLVEDGAVEQASVAAHARTEDGKNEDVVHEINVDADMDEASISVNDDVLGERIMVYDVNKPSLRVGTMYPNMVAFRLAVRQFAINADFELDLKATYKKCYIGGYKRAKNCPWHVRTSGLGHLSVVYPASGNAEEKEGMMEYYQETRYVGGARRIKFSTIDHRDN
uniref:Transposase MuDR plant domain-containing protein n=1 Tax=Oryza brachyantha TaxID=4533 RepID=J3L0Y1_ORYBR